MKNMNILFAGSPQISAEILKNIIKNNSINVIGVITKPDKPQKRGNKTLESHVSLIAKANNIDLFKPTDLNSDKFIKRIINMEIDCLVVIAYGKKIPDWLLECSKLLSINLHFSLLPKYRGASPIQSALINNDKKTGVTFIKLNSELDSGEIIKSYKCAIDFLDKKSTLEKKLCDLSIEKFPEVFDLIKSNKYKLKKQNNNKSSYCKKIVKDDSMIDFSKGSIEIYNRYRAFEGWPGTNFLFSDILIKIHKLHISDTKSSDKPGTIHKFSKDGIYVNTIDKLIVITHLQFPNKNIISSSDAYNSHRDFFI